MKKSEWSMILILCMITVCFNISGCGIAKNGTISNEHSTIIPSEMASAIPENHSDIFERMDILDANALTSNVESNIDHKSEIASIVEKEPGYEKEYKDLIAFVGAIISAQDSVMYKQEECYVSRLPIYYWLATDNKVNEVRVDLLVFSKDLKKSATYSLLYEDGKNPTGSISDTEENTFEILKEHKKTKYIFIENGPSMLLLNAKNEILNDIGYRPKVTVKGDYYHALDYKTLAVSYQDLTSEKNLVKFKLKVKGDKVIDLIH